MKPGHGSLPATRRTDAEFEWSPQGEERRWIYIVVHHSATTQGSVEAIHNEHSRRKDALGRNWLGIGYHFVIGNGQGMDDGEIEPTFRWRNQIHGAHSGSAVHNANGVGICLIGNFQNESPTQQQLKSLEHLIRQLATRYKIPPRLIIGHRKVKPTQCPGTMLPLEDIVRKALTTPQAVYGRQQF